MYGNLDIAVSGMIAQRTRLETITANIVNKDAILDSAGKVNPFRRRIAVFMPGDPSASSASGRALGVHVGQILEDRAPFKMQLEPTSPYRQPEGSPDAGYVYYPNVDPVQEQVNAIDAMRAYEANAMAAEATKSMVAQALRLIA